MHWKHDFVVHFVEYADSSLHSFASSLMNLFVESSCCWQQTNA